MSPNLLRFLPLFFVFECLFRVYGDLYALSKPLDRYLHRERERKRKRRTHFQLSFFSCVYLYALVWYLILKTTEKRTRSEVKAPFSKTFFFFLGSFLFSFLRLDLLSFPALFFHSAKQEKRATNLSFALPLFSSPSSKDISILARFS